MGVVRGRDWNKCQNKVLGTLLRAVPKSRARSGSPSPSTREGQRGPGRGAAWDDPRPGPVLGEGGFASETLSPTQKRRSHEKTLANPKRPILEKPSSQGP